MGCVTSVGKENGVEKSGIQHYGRAIGYTGTRRSIEDEDDETYYSQSNLFHIRAAQSGFGSTSHLHKSALGEDFVAQRLVRELSKKVSDAALTPEYKYIALVAHNEMKPSMMNFVKRHIDFFRGCRIVTTGSTGSALEQKLGLRITLKVSSGPLGGDQEIGALISQRQLGAVFFFRDPLSSHPHESDIQALARLCDVHNVMASTNPASGDALVHSLQHSKKARDLLLHDNARQHEETDVVKAYKRRQAAVINNVAQDGKPAGTPSKRLSNRTQKTTPKQLPVPSQPTPKVVKRSKFVRAPKITVTHVDSPLRDVVRETPSRRYPTSDLEIDYQMGASEIALVDNGGRTMPHLYSSDSQSKLEVSPREWSTPRAH